MTRHTNIHKQSSKANIFYICGQTDIGIDCYYYVEVLPQKVPLFKKIRKGEAVDITKYGTVLYKGYGTPDTDVIEAMQRDYGFDTPQA